MTKGTYLSTLQKRYSLQATIAQVTWSEMEQEFWVYVVQHGEEGWVPLKPVSFDETCTSVLPTPTLPSVLKTLPRIVCVDAMFSVYEYPALPLPEGSTEWWPYRGKRVGDTQGKGDGYFIGEAKNYAWSETTEEFYVLIKQDKVEGWVELYIVDFERNCEPWSPTSTP